MKDTADITRLKAEIYDTIEAQAVLQHQHQQLEEKKAVLAKQLGEARKAAAAEQKGDELDAE